MTLSRSRANFVEILQDTSNRVIALSGKWGTGKSHLWRDVQAASIDPSVKEAVYISLFGLSSIVELKLKVMQTVVPKLGGAKAEAVRNMFAGVRKVLKGIHSSFSALDELALAAAPIVLKERFIVIDDVERKHEKLNIDEILGFIDDLVQNHGCRILLILNTDQLGDKNVWELFREKVIDQELRLDISPEEAFDIAVRGQSVAHADALRAAVRACLITNIRVIRKVVRVADKILAGRQSLQPEVVARVVPSIVLLCAIHYKALDDGPDFDFVRSFRNGLARRLGQQGQSEKEQPTPESKKRERWFLLLNTVGLNDADEFEGVVIDFLQSGLLDLSEVRRIVDGYAARAETLRARDRRFAYYDTARWHPDVSEAELLDKLREMIPQAEHHDMHAITELHDEANQLNGGKEVARDLIRSWLTAFRRKVEEGQDGEFDSDYNFYHRKVHPEIEAEIRGLQVRHRARTTVLDVCRKVAEERSWGEREQMIMRSATPADFEVAIGSASGRNLMLLLLQGLDFAKNRHGYEQYFGAGIDSFVAACRNLCQRDDVSDRRKALIRDLFKDAGREEDLKPTHAQDSAAPQVVPHSPSQSSK